MTGDGGQVGGGGKALPPSSGFSGDDGSADPALAATLTAFHAGQAPLRDVVSRLAATRVLVPILAELEAAEEGEHGHTVDKEASAGVVALQAPDGRRALPVFTSVAAMAAWRADARPVPVDARRAALSAVSEDWALLVVDPAGPVTALVPRPAVWALAQGEEWHPAVVDGTVDDAVQQAVTAAVTGVPHVARGWAEPGRRAEVAVVLRIDPGLDRAGLDAVLAQVNAALAADDVISGRVDGLELRIGRAG
ncbi:SseB family protein [Cellulosimicrobium marinum]|uniref:SseB family protein n=1 Tax=Cellulosimicrobium marinum TaxID=1638992 RepID=UPI001E36A225|nr:SseB family protein [Cellulosimicrobium marinum]MCB7137811.1 SseB family protein [Cellulosimicrobium marinum]